MKKDIEPKRRYSFAIMAQSSAFLDIVKDWADPERYALEYAVFKPDTAVEIAENFLASGMEAVLYEGGPRNAIAKTFGSSAIPIVRTEIDIINAIKTASAYSKELVYTMYSVDEHNISDMEELLQVKLHTLEADTYEKLGAAIKKIHDQGQRYLVGGYFEKKYIESLGGKGFLIVPSLYSINKGFQAAERFATSRRSQYRNRDSLFAMFQQMDEAVVCIDDEEQVLFATPKALDFLKLPHNASTEEWRPFFKTLCLPETLADMVPRKNVPVEANNEKYLVTTIPHVTIMGRRNALALFRDTSAIRQMSRKLDEHLSSKGFTARYRLEHFLGKTPVVRELKKRVRRFAPTDAAVFIHGETGTGKEILAHALHAESKRKKQAFIAVNCAAMPENLIESELFGYESGAFTGAQRGGKPGLFEMAHKGTLFLDEIGEMSHGMQLRLLRVLEAGEVMRLGGRRLHPVDVRILCASHKHLLHLVAENAFRQDLYYRVSTLKLHVPPLRERPEDIEFITGHILQRFDKNKRSISPEIIGLLQKHHWPGNVRELIATLESYCLLLESDKPDPALFAAILEENSGKNHGAAPDGVPNSLKEAVAFTQSAMIDNAIRRHNGDKSAAAKSLGISYSKLWRLLRDSRTDTHPL